MKNGAMFGAPSNFSLINNFEENDMDTSDKLNLRNKRIGEISLMKSKCIMKL